MFKRFKGKRILITPLNWGLGHGTRCIPLIKILEEAGATIIIGSDGATLQLLRRYFPEKTFEELPSYHIKYWSNNMMINAILLAPFGLWARFAENVAIKRLIKNHQIDVIISDNRFGCWNKRVENIFITHQLNLVYRIKWFEAVLNYFNKRWRQRFEEIWVPDYMDSMLSGKLSSESNDSNVHFVGPLSIHEKTSGIKDVDVLVLLSGPEPQRTKLEGLLIKMLEGVSELKVVFVAGSNNGVGVGTKEVEYHYIMYGNELTKMLNRSKLIICRSGYSTLMDVYDKDIATILIPTPDQSEQEYLGGRFAQIKKHSKYISQQEIELLSPAKFQTLMKKLLRELE